MRVCTLLVAVACVVTSGPLFSAAAVAPAEQRPAEAGGEVAAEVRVEIGNIAGSVRVTGWDRNEVRVQGTLGEGVERLRFDNGHRDVGIGVELPRRRRGERADVGESHLEIDVPRGATLEIETLAAAIAVIGVDGDVRLENTAGTITYAGAARFIEVGTASGDIEVDSSADGAAIEVEAIAGNVLVQLSAGDVRASTVTGNVRVIGGRVREGDFESVSGELYFEGAIVPTGDLSFENFNGDIDLLIPSDSSAVFDITSYSGPIETEFGFEARQLEAYSPEQQAEFTLGSGAAAVDIETFAGSVSVRRR